VAQLCNFGASAATQLARQQQQIQPDGTAADTAGSTTAQRHNSAAVNDKNMNKQSS
jgi:hypothetical protein